MAEHNQAVEQKLSLTSDGQSGASNNAGSTQRLLDASNGVPVRVADVSRSGLPEISLDSSRAQRSASSSPCSASAFRGSFRGPLSSVLSNIPILSNIVDKFKSLLNLDGGGEDDEGEDDGEEKSASRSKPRVRGDEAGANTYLANAMSLTPGLGLALKIINNVSQSAKSGGCDGGECSSPKRAAARAESPRGRYSSTANKMIMGLPGYGMGADKPTHT